MRIFYFNRTNGGACDYYRAVLPLTTLAKLDKSYMVSSMSEEDTKIAVANDDHRKILPLLEADIIVIPRLAELAFLRKIKEMNRAAKIVCEYDDNLFDISPLSPHYVDHGTENVTLIHKGQRLDVWVDGKNIDLAKNRKTMEDVREILGEADLVTVTTEILAQTYRSYGANVAVLPNCIDATLWKRLPLRAHEGLRMGWFGGASHYEDWTLLEPILPEVMNRVKDLTLVIMGSKFSGTVKELPEDRIEYHGWCPTVVYPYKAAILDLDFAVIPLRDTPFNRCKSNIKWIEMGAIEVPCVGSYVSPYREAATEENGVWIEHNDADAWMEGILRLATDPMLRLNIGASARDTVMRQFEIQANAPKWGHAYQEVLSGVTHKPNLIRAG